MIFRTLRLAARKVPKSLRWSSLFSPANFIPLKSMESIHQWLETYNTYEIADSSIHNKMEDIMLLSIQDNQLSIVNQDTLAILLGNLYANGTTTETKHFYLNLLIRYYLLTGKHFDSYTLVILNLDAVSLNTLELAVVNLVRNSYIEPVIELLKLINNKHILTSRIYHQVFQSALLAPDVSEQLLIDLWNIAVFEGQHAYLSYGELNQLSLRIHDEKTVRDIRWYFQYKDSGSFNKLAIFHRLAYYNSLLPESYHWRVFQKMITDFDEYLYPEMQDSNYYIKASDFPDLIDTLKAKNFSLDEVFSNTLSKTNLIYIRTRYSYLNTLFFNIYLHSLVSTNVAVVKLLGNIKYLVEEIDLQLNMESFQCLFKIAENSMYEKDVCELYRAYEEYKGFGALENWFLKATLERIEKPQNDGL